MTELTNRGDVVIYYAIKYPDGSYKTPFNKTSTELRNARLYKGEKWAIENTDGIRDIDYKIVTIKMEETE